MEATIIIKFKKEVKSVDVKSKSYEELKAEFEKKYEHFLSLSSKYPEELKADQEYQKLRKLLVAVTEEMRKRRRLLKL